MSKDAEILNRSSVRIPVPRPQLPQQYGEDLRRPEKQNRRNSAGDHEVRPQKAARSAHLRERKAHCGRPESRSVTWETSASGATRSDALEVWLHWRLVVAGCGSVRACSKQATCLHDILSRALRRFAERWALPSKLSYKPVAAQPLHVGGDRRSPPSRLLKPASAACLKNNVIRPRCRHL